MAGGDLVKTVSKLKCKLQEAASHGYQEDGVRKILQRLAAVPMTLELLQLTHIGKEVNGLRKIDGDVGRMAKQLVKTWKLLLVEGGESPATSFLAPPTSSTRCSLSPVSQVDEGREREEEGERGEGREMGEGKERGNESGSWSLPLAGHRKRKAVLDTSVDVVTYTKRSRTQVYSGKKTASGPQVVMSLFDMSMKILIDNIDAIEEVGGVPYLILEPLLQKCTATQLLRLEEFNPHFLEDSDVLWEKHCQRDFRGFQRQSHQTWRQLYLSKLSEREQRLKNITASIRKREEARKEPVRQVKLAAATRAPGRRRHMTSPPFPPSRSFRSGLDRPAANVSKLKKQTMKMVKERSLMTHAGKR